jgi:hypothetical protein
MSGCHVAATFHREGSSAGSFSVAETPGVSKRKMASRSLR